MSLIEDAVKSFALAHLLPLVGVLFSVGVLAYGGVKIAERSAYHSGYHDGGADVRDSASKATIKRLTAQHVTDSATSAANYASAVVTQRHLDSALINDKPRTLNKIVAMRPVEDAPDSLVPTIPLSHLVQIVTAQPDTGYATPNMAHLIAWQDTVIYQCCHRTVTVDSAVALALQWKKYGTSEHLVRLDSDSSAAMWKLRYETSAHTDKSRHSVTWTVALTTASAILGAVIHNNIRR